MKRKIKRKKQTITKSKKQLNLFDSTSKLTASTEWNNMPEYICSNSPKPATTATFKFETMADFDEFERLLKKHGIFDDNKILFSRKDNKQAWYPQKNKSTDFKYVDGNEPIKTKFPIYIISRGRYKKRFTADILESMGVPYNIVVRDDEYKKYKKVVKGRVIVLPQKYIDDYDMYWEDDDKRTGPGPSRNFVWDHSISEGHNWHWILDDNINAFLRFNNNLKIKCETMAPFAAMEDFALRYENIAILAPHYSFFIAEKSFYRPYVANTRVMSCMLVRNDIPFRWRGRYNEDVDMAIRILKSGWCTIQFNAFLQRKLKTQVLGGGCTDELYVDGTSLKSKMLMEMHPDVVKLVERYGRIHHFVDFKKFKGNKLIRKPDYQVNSDNNEFGMILKK